MTVELNLQPLSPTPGLGVGAEGSNPLSMPWSFWQPAPILKLAAPPHTPQGSPHLYKLWCGQKGVVENNQETHRTLRTCAGF